MSDQKLEPIYIESLMTREEWKARYRAGYPSSTKPEPPQMFESHFKWRYGMGSKLSPAEVKLINDRIEILRKLVKQKT